MKSNMLIMIQDKRLGWGVRRIWVVSSDQWQETRDGQIVALRVC